MDDNLQTHWYLVRTKTGKERWVRDQLASRVPEVFLPMLKAKVPRWGRMAVSIAPLFPCYVFARFDLQSQYFDVKYMAGVRAIVSAGNDPLAVPTPIVTEIRRRGVDDVIEIPESLPSLATPIVYAVPLQLLSYYMSVILGHDPDYPRNLAKSVTVE